MVPSKYYTKVPKIGSWRKKMGKTERGSFSVGSIGTTTILLTDATMIPTEVQFFVGSTGTATIGSRHISVIPL